MVNLKNKLVIEKLPFSLDFIKSLKIYDDKYVYSFYCNFFNETYEHLKWTLLDSKKKISRKDFHKIKNCLYIDDFQKEIILNMNREYLLQISVLQLIELIGMEEHLI